MKKISVGDFIVPQRLSTVCESVVGIPADSQITHIQFRRFASCPICNLHIHSFVSRHLELVEAGVHEVVVFHSTAEDILSAGGEVPFAMIADPTKELYKVFGVETSIMSVANPAAWVSGVKGLVKFPRFPHEKGQGHFGLPADFIIGKNGEVLFAKYGKHADDHLEVDEVIRLARRFSA